MSSAIGTIQSMGWEKDEAGEEVFYVHMRFVDAPKLSPLLCWESIPMALMTAASAEIALATAALARARSADEQVTAPAPAENATAG